MITNRKIKIAMIIAIIVLFAIAASTMGISYAIRTSPDGSIGGGESTASPSVTPDANNVWAKYFKGNVITVDGQEYAEITTYYDADAGLALSDIFIPNIIDIEGNLYAVYRITNSIFADSTLTTQPVKIHIPSNVRELDDAAFASLPNLETVYFANANTCTIGSFAFAGCAKLSKLIKIGTGDFVLKKDFAFAFEGTQIKVENNIISFS